MRITAYLGYAIIPLLFGGCGALKTKSNTTAVCNDPSKLSSADDATKAKCAAQSTNPDGSTHTRPYVRVTQTYEIDSPAEVGALESDNRVHSAIYQPSTKKYLFLKQRIGQIAPLLVTSDLHASDLAKIILSDPSDAESIWFDGKSTYYTSDVSSRRSFSADGKSLGSTMFDRSCAGQSLFETDQKLRIACGASHTICDVDTTSGSPTNCINGPGNQIVAGQSLGSSLMNGNSSSTAWFKGNIYGIAYNDNSGTLTVFDDHLVASKIYDVSSTVGNDDGPSDTIPMLIADQDGLVEVINTTKRPGKIVLRRLELVEGD